MRFGPFDSRAPDDVGERGWWRASPGRVELVWFGFASIVVAGGNELVVTPADGADPAQLRSVLLGQASSFLFAQQGHLPLHAAAIEVEGRVFAVTAEAGVGKSTAGAALLARGARHVADDLLPVDLSAGGATVHPGHSIVKLSERTRAALDLDLVERPIVYAREGKRAYRPPIVAERRAHELAGVLFLESGPEFAFEPLHGPRALFALQGACHRRDALPVSVGAQAWLERCATAAERVGVARLAWPRDLARLDEMAERTLGALAAWSR